MIDRPRTTGVIAASDRVRQALAALRADAGVDAPAELNLERVQEVEAAFGTHLPDDVLAAYAAEVPRLRDRHRMTIGGVVGHTGTLRENRARGDLIGLGQLGPRQILCVRKGAGEARLLCYDLDDRSSEPFDLADWLTELCGRDRLPEASVFCPRLIAFQPESTMKGRRVRHKVFGEGKALQEIGTGPNRKVQVDFPGRGLKLLQARFLDFLD